MPAIKISKFLGESPRTSSENLPESAAQVAFNTKLYSGDLLPYRRPVAAGSTARLGPTKTLYGLKDPDTGEVKFLSWANDVDVVSGVTLDADDQRFFYTGDGEPKVSNYALATTGSGAFPITAYNLGLPLPETKITPTAATFTTLVVSTASRDSGAIATITTTTPHGLRTGNVVSVSGFTFRSGTYAQSGTTITVTLTGHGLTSGANVFLNFVTGDSISGVYSVSVTGTNTFTVVAPDSKTTSGNANLSVSEFNFTNVRVTVVNDTTLAYFSPGPQMAPFTASDGRIDLTGNTQLRTYLYTWVTPWGEESIGSEPSDDIFLREGQKVTLTNLPTAPPSNDTFIRGIRVYRTVPGTTTSRYFRLRTLWFPVGVVSVARTSGVATVRTVDPHNLSVRSRFKISGCTDTSFNITDGIVTEVIDRYTFSYTQAGSNVSTTADTTGTLFHDAAETRDLPARYWGDGSDFDFIDDFLVSNLTFILESTDFSPPPKRLQGLRLGVNNILVGFVDNEVYFSEPGKPHAWPDKYRYSIDADIVAVEPVAGFFLVLTKDYPYIIQGNSPDVFSVSRIDTPYPCVSKRSVVNMGYGAVFATHGGLAAWSPGTSMRLVTEFIHDWDTWNEELDPTSIIGHFYNGKYFGSHTRFSFLFENDEQVGGYFVGIEYRFTAAWTDPETNRMYYVTDGLGNVFEWDNETQPLATLEWKSKTIKLPEYANMGVARVIADFIADEAEIERVNAFNENVVVINTQLFIDYTDKAFADINGPYDIIDNNSNRVENFGGFNSTAFNGDNILSRQIEFSGALPVTFRLWSNKQLVFQASISDDGIFRLPMGYMSDTYEVGVSGGARVRAIHLGETPVGLKQV